MPSNLAIIESLRRITTLLIDPRQPASSLRPEIIELTTLINNSNNTFRHQQQDISAGETRTDNGLALSPTMAAMCADDFVRTIQFLRGAHAAIADIRKQSSDRPVRVLYAGCGPYAILSLPLMATFPPEEVLFTLLDVHQASIESARSIIESFNLNNSVEHFETIDAAKYKIDDDNPPDIILMEIMQTCLENEPQVAITRHLLQQAPDTLLVPEEIRVELTLVDPACEFNTTGIEKDGGTIQRDRIPVAPIFVVNRETVKSWSALKGSQLPAATVQMPHYAEQKYQPMLFTNIRVYQQHTLEDYDSGLICPRVLTIDDTIGSGDTIQFHYELGIRPKIKGTLTKSESSL